MLFEKEGLKRLVAWYKGKKAGPLRIDIEPTSTCNLKCRFCWTRSEERLRSCQYQRTLTDKRLLEIVEEAARLGVKEWQIAGGWEPMTKPRTVFKMMVLIKKYGMYGCLTTNGTLFTKSMIKKLVEIGWDQILFSLEGPSAEVHDYLTQVRGSFEKEVGAIRAFKEWKEKLGKDKPNYSIHSVLTNKNYDKLEEMVRLGHELRCSGVNFEPLIVWSEEGRKLTLDKRQRSELKIHIEKALNVAREFGVYTNVENLREEKLVDKKDMRTLLKEEISDKEKNIVNAPCFNPWLNLEIRVSGRVTPCRLCNDETGCDNIMDKSLEEIWYGAYFEEMRKNMINHKLPEYCMDCASGLIVEMRELRRKLMKTLTPLGLLKMRLM